MRPFRPIAPAVAFCLLLCAAGARGQTPATARTAMDPSLAEATYRAVIAHLAGELRDAPPDIAPAVLCFALGNDGA